MLLEFGAWLKKLLASKEVYVCSNVTKYSYDEGEITEPNEFDNARKVRQFSRDPGRHLSFHDGDYDPTE